MYLIHVSIFALFFFWNHITCTTLQDKFHDELQHDHHRDMRLILNCIRNISQDYSVGRDLIFLTEQINTDLSEYLVLHTNRQLKIISSIGNISKTIGMYYLFQDTRSFVDILEKIPPNNVMRFIVILDFQSKIDLRQIQSILEEFWLFQIIDVVVLVPFKVSKNIRVYTYYPYSPTRCGETGPPILINVWNSQNREFLNSENLFTQRKKVYNLHGCPLKCMGVHRPPESTITKLSNNKWELSGTGNKVFKFVESHLNFTAHVMLFRKEQQKSYKVKNGSLTNVKFDIAFGKFIRALDTEPNADFVTENRMDCFTWAVPHGIGRQPSIWTNYIIEYSAITWLLIVISIFSTSILIFWIVRRLRRRYHDWNTYRYVLFFTFSTFIGATVKLRPESHILRVSVAQWLLCSLVVTASYQAYMGSLMTIRRTEPELNRQQDLLNTTLNLIGRQEMYGVLNESISNSGGEFAGLMDRFFVIPATVELDSVISRMAERRDIALFTSKRELIYYAHAQHRDGNSEKRRIHIFTDCVVKSYASAFMLRKGSPYLYPIHNALRRLIETGIYNYWDDDNIRDEIYHNIMFTKDTVLVLRELYGAFVVLFVGLSLAVFVFILEMFVSLMKEHQLHNL